LRRAEDTHVVDDGASLLWNDEDEGVMWRASSHSEKKTYELLEV